jgi:ribose 5-phosphate isomerase B
MKVYLATDHAGFELKEKIKLFLQQGGYEIEDCGAYGFDANDDYPDFVSKAANKVRVTPDSFGIILGGTGQGEAMVANKFKGIRCALFYTPAVPHSSTDINAQAASSDPFEMLRVTRKHNDSNMLALSGRFLKAEDAVQAVKTFLETGFTKDERHVRRIDKMKMIEEVMGTMK